MLVYGFMRCNICNVCTYNKCNIILKAIIMHVWESLTSLNGKNTNFSAECCYNPSYLGKTFCRTSFIWLNQGIIPLIVQPLNS